MLCRATPAGHIGRKGLKNPLLTSLRCESGLPWRAQFEVWQWVGEGGGEGGVWYLIAFWWGRLSVQASGQVVAEMIRSYQANRWIIDVCRLDCDSLSVLVLLTCSLEGIGLVDPSPAPDSLLFPFYDHVLTLSAPALWFLLSPPLVLSLSFAVSNSCLFSSYVWLFSSYVWLSAVFVPLLSVHPSFFISLLTPFPAHFLSCCLLVWLLLWQQSFYVDRF